MEMRIDFFENQVNPRIADRGRAYYLDGRVGDLQVIGDTYSALVQGTEDHHVHAVVSKDGEILSVGCDCPYDQGPYCKHELALLFAVRETMPEMKGGQIPPEEEPGSEKEPSLRFSSLSRKQLESLLLKAASRHPDVGQQIVLSLTTGEHKLEEAAEMVRFGIDQGSPDGFFEVEDRDEIAGGFNLVLEEARESEDPEEAIALILTAIQVCREAIRPGDDSEYLLGDLINEAKETLTQIVVGARDRLTPSKKTSVFRLILVLVAENPEEELRMHEGRLFTLLLDFCDDESLRSKYETLLEKIEKSLPPPKDTLSGFSLVQMFEMTEYQYISRWKSQEERRAFLKERMANPDLRSIAIHEAIDAKEWDSALELVEDGVCRDSLLPGIVRRWEKFAFVIHNERGDTDDVRILAEKFLLDGDFSYYDAYIRTFPDETREKGVDVLLQGLGKNHRGSAIIDKVLIAENRFGELMNYCEADPSRISELFSHLQDRYPDRVDGCFFQWILGTAKSADSRSRYRAVCDQITLYRRVCGERHRRAVGTLRELYPRKSAFMDELKRFK